MDTFRISKYDPKYRDFEGNFKKNDWTSISDIGQVFNNNLFTKEEYLITENKYARTIIELTECLDINSFSINNLIKLEINFSKNYSSLYDNELINFYKLISKNQEIFCADFEKIIRLILREDISGHLENKFKKLSIDFGYDYYMFIEIDPKYKPKLNEICQKNGLFMEDSGFPISFEFEE